MKASTKKKLAVFAVILFFLAVAALYAYLYLIPNITGALTPTAIVSYGRMQITDEEDCLVVRSEEAVYAEEDGTIHYYSEENERTRKASKILDLYPEGGSAKSYTAPYTAFISYYIDGLESEYTPETIGQLDPETALKVNTNPSNTKRETAKKGEALYKLISNNVWYTVLFVEKDKSNLYKLNQSVTLYFGDDDVKGYVSEVYNRRDYDLIVIKINYYYENFARLRSAHIKLLTQDYDGLIVPNSAVAYQEVPSDGDAPPSEKPGVYVLGINGDYTFRTVDIITSTENETLIKTDGNVKIYDEILRNANQ